MKKFLSAALALCLAFSLAACGGSGSSTPASTAPSGGTAGSGAAIKIGGTALLQAAPRFTAMP